MEVLDGSGNEPQNDQEELDPLPLQMAGIICCILALLYSKRMLVHMWCWIRLKLHREPQGATLASPPPPQARLNELDESFPFNKEVEVINLITPSPGSNLRRSHLATSTAKRTSPRAGPSKATPKAVDPGRATPATASTPATGTARTLFSTPAQEERPPEPTHQGWDPALLAASAATEGYISSLAGLQQSAQFQTHIKARHGNVSRYLEQVEARLDTWHMLRSIDREAFLHAFTRSNILDIDSQPPHLLLCLLEATLTSAITFVLFFKWYAQGGDWAGLLSAWLVVQLLGAWCWGHPSLLARWLSIYCVQGCERYPEHHFTAPGWRVVAAGLLDALFTCSTCGVSALVACVLIIARWARQTPGQLLMRIQPMKESILGQVTVPKYPSPRQKVLVVQRAGMSRLPHSTLERNTLDTTWARDVPGSHSKELHTPRSISLWNSPAAPTGVPHSTARTRAGPQSVTQQRGRSRTGPKALIEPGSQAGGVAAGAGVGWTPLRAAAPRGGSPMSQRGGSGAHVSVDPATALRRAAATPLPPGSGSHQPWTFGSGRPMLPPVEDNPGLLFNMQPGSASPSWHTPGSLLKRRHN